MSSSSSLQTEAEAFAFRKLLEHMKWRNETIQNIEMMNLTGFCRNCLAKWLLLGKKNARLKSTYEMCQEEVYGMTQKEWKEKWQMKATEEVLEKFKSGQEMHAKHPKDLMEAVAALPLQPRANNNNNNNNKNNTKENNANMLSDVCCEDIEGEEVCITRDTVDGTVNEGFHDNISFGIITVSDRAFNGVYEDISGNVVMRETIETYFKTNDRDDSINSTEIIRGYKLVPDEKEEIAKAISYMSDELKCDVVLTTGGTGLAKRDVTPEATKSVLTREVKGIAESLRAHARRYERHAALSRAVAGLRNDQSLIVNLPGRPNAVSSSLAVLLPMLPHAVRQMKS
jgi:molybdopterin adenylyltransferase